MSNPQSSPPSPDAPARSSRWLIILAATLVVVFALVFARFALFSPKGAAEGPQGGSSLANASPFATATQVSGGTTGGNGTVVAGATPFMTPVIAGYPAPNVLSEQEKQILQQVPAQYGQQESKVILVSLTGQYLQAIENGKIVLWTYVITGRGSLSTPTGFFKIFRKDSPLTFYPASTDPKSPFFGFPSKVQYGMEFLDGGFYIHDAWWHSIYGPGLTFNHYDPGRLEWQEGSHGCVNTPLHAMVFLFQWAPMYTPVIVF